MRGDKYYLNDQDGNCHDNDDNHVACFVKFYQNFKLFCLKQALLVDKYHVCISKETLHDPDENYRGNENNLAGVVMECITSIGTGNPLGIYQCVMVRKIIIH